MFTTEALIRAMAPIDHVIDTFQVNYQNVTAAADDSASASAPEIDKNDVPEYVTEMGQGIFAGIVYKIIQPPDPDVAANNVHVPVPVPVPVPATSVFQPTNRYIRKLLQRFAHKVEQITHLENEDFAELMMEYQFRAGTSGGGGGDMDMPDPHKSGHLSFSVPLVLPTSGSGESSSSSSSSSLSSQQNQNDKSIVGIKVFPHHNDVGVRKLWEAGAALTEYLMEHPELVRGKHVVELGAGVGLTGLVIAGLCGTASVHMTDYTDATLANMEHNVALNQEWIAKARREQGCVANDEHQAVTTVSTCVCAAI